MVFMRCVSGSVAMREMKRYMLPPPLLLALGFTPSVAAYDTWPCCRWPRPYAGPVCCPCAAAAALAAFAASALGLPRPPVAAPRGCGPPAPALRCAPARCWSTSTGSRGPVLPGGRPCLGPGFCTACACACACACTCCAAACVRDMRTICAWYLRMMPAVDPLKLKLPWRTCSVSLLVTSARHLACWWIQCSGGLYVMALWNTRNMSASNSWMEGYTPCAMLPRMLSKHMGLAMTLE
mmetsp:Transcript_17689/g.44523  ORF Transcript_17689/g.44523 Transcript_17689/m.44523 type:complete len:237 (+) Transcript_17689:2030-2740(+)